MFVYKCGSGRPSLLIPKLQLTKDDQGLSPLGDGLVTGRMSLICVPPLNHPLPKPPASPQGNPRLTRIQKNLKLQLVKKRHRTQHRMDHRNRNLQQATTPPSEKVGITLLCLMLISAGKLCNRFSYSLAFGVDFGGSKGGRGKC